MMDSGVRSGGDIGRACALGAAAAFAGRAFFGDWARSASRARETSIDLLIEETQAALGQLGARTVQETRTLAIRHPGALQFS
jgi:isopentenyl diphosphate isomerase/L-lactate dehydrogenase-like FMN-dependent dehydrogenase